MRQSKILLPITLVLALPLVTGCLEETTGIVIFDNGAASVITVSIDGEDVATVEPGHSKPITIDLGERHIQVKHGSQVTYDEKHDFNYGERPYRRPMWILNPDETHCYCDVSVQYGFDEYVAARHDRIARMIESLNEFDDAGPLDEAQEIDRAKLVVSMKGHIAHEFRQILNDLETFPDGPLVQIEAVGTILAPVNDTIYTRHSDSEERSSLVRIPRVLRDKIQQLAAIESPTIEDLQDLLIAQSDARVFVHIKGESKETIDARTMEVKKRLVDEQGSH
ncbi:MAG: hypothetical protein KDB27_34400 [Planctomycetales bacterium]|nr:hypothetical protein [Planctomycetales bacterium]